MKIGIDLGGSHIGVGIVTEEGKILGKKEENIQFTKQQNIKELIRDTIVSLINQLLREVQMPIFVVKQIGIGIPGIVKENKILKIEKFKIEYWDLAKELEQHYEIPVKIQNDAICSTKAEREYGNLKDTKKAVFLCLGTGIGGATILEDKIISSEYGHMIIKVDGKECHCKNKDCFETYGSMQVFKQEIIKCLKLKENTTSEEILSIIKSEKENLELNEYIDSYIKILAIGICNIINIINPEVICIGGSFVYFEEILYKKLKEEILKVTTQYEKPKILLAKLENTAGIIGATL